MRPDFDAALQAHFDAIENRDMEAFRSHLTKGPVLYTIVQNGHAFTTPHETISIHEEWFASDQGFWTGEVIHKVEGEDMAMALVRYDFRNQPEDEPFTSWLTYVFRLEDGEWRIVHDQSTALDYQAFARASGLD